MNYLGFSETELESTNSIYTAKEIAQQPALWALIRSKIANEKSNIVSFLDQVLPKVDTIILTGAGTSAFIGHSLTGEIQRTTGITTLSIATTHIVSHPKDYFQATASTLLISFARSGNSPESVATLSLADQYCKKCYHLVITCNEDGALAKYKFQNTSYAFILPKEANDKSLAMTGSYSGMLLAALMINCIKTTHTLIDTTNHLISKGEAILAECLKPLKHVASLPFKRAIFLGSGPQYGTAVESHLKLQELTDGQVICKYDSYLGFRHGPKAVVDEETLMIYYFSNDPDVFRYEKDLVLGMNKGKKPLYQIGISENKLENLNLDFKYVLPNSELSVNEAFLSVATIMVGQILAFFKSKQLGLSPDSPSTSKAISRVVEGVTIY